MSKEAAAGPKRSRGRPPTLTPEIQRRVVALVGNGTPVATACAVVGLPRSTFYDWMQRGGPAEGSARSGPYRAFREAVEQARAQGEAAMVASLVDAARHRDWRSAAAWLAGAYPERWGPAVRTPSGRVIRTRVGPPRD